MISGSARTAWPFELPDRMPINPMASKKSLELEVLVLGLGFWPVGVTKPMVVLSDALQNALRVGTPGRL